MRMQRGGSVYIRMQCHQISLQLDAIGSGSRDDVTGILDAIAGIVNRLQNLRLSYGSSASIQLELQLAESSIAAIKGELARARRLTRRAAGESWTAENAADALTHARRAVGYAFEAGEWLDRAEDLMPGDNEETIPPSIDVVGRL